MPDDSPKGGGLELMRGRHTWVFMEVRLWYTMET